MWRVSPYFLCPLSINLLGVVEACSVATDSDLGADLRLVAKAKCCEGSRSAERSIAVEATDQVVRYVPDMIVPTCCEGEPLEPVYCCVLDVPFET